MKKLFAATLVALSTVILWTVLKGQIDYGFWLAPPHEKLQRAWQTDLSELKSHKQLPSNWGEIRESNFSSASPLLQEWLNQIPSPIKINQKGSLRLESFFIFWNEGIRYGVIIQYSLINLHDQRTIWEMGRTLPLGVLY